jgi:hypothetical protein
MREQKKKTRKDGDEEKDKEERAYCNFFPLTTYRNFISSHYILKLLFSYYIPQLRWLSLIAPPPSGIVAVLVVVAAMLFPKG